MPTLTVYDVLTSSLLEGVTMKGQRLIQSTVKALAYDPAGPKTQITWCAELPGFGVRLYPSGKASYVAFYRVGKGRAARQRFHVIGSTAKLSPDQARTRARKLLVDALDGLDPVAEQAAALEAKRAADALELERHAFTFAALAEKYISGHALKRSLRSDRERLKNHVVPALGAIPAGLVSRADVARMHQAIAERRSGPTANRCTALTSAIFNWAEKHGALPIGHANPARGVERFEETSRDRWLTREELRRVLQALEKHESIYFRGFIWLALLTGARKGELLAAKWDHVSFEERTLRLPRTKSGKVHHVPLSGPAVEILQQIPRQAGNPYVFPGARAGQHLVGVDRPWQAICASAGLQDVHLHDLRRTVGSRLAQSGASLGLIGSLLNHANLSTTAVYARLADSNRVDALEAHGQALLDVVQPLGPAS